MKNRRLAYLCALLMFGFHVSYGQVQTDAKSLVKFENKGVAMPNAPKSMVRTIRQDSKGNIWLASPEGVIKYDGQSFTNITGSEIKARFFSVLEDRKGNFWFASVNKGVFYYDGKTFRNYTTKDGLASNQVSDIYEDKAGNIWFSTESGASSYDGKSFQNLMPGGNQPARQQDSVQSSQPVPQDHNDVNAIIEDNTGKLWFGTKGYVRVYDPRLPGAQGKTFTTMTDKDGKAFTNVRSIIKDKKGNIWLGGADGLWRYDGRTFTNFTQKFVGYICEDRQGNIWTSSVSARDARWALSRYDAKTLSASKPTVTEVKSGEGMLCGIIEANDGSIWFGTMTGVYRYDGFTFNDFKGK